MKNILLRYKHIFSLVLVSAILIGASFTFHGNTPAIISPYPPAVSAQSPPENNCPPGEVPSQLKGGPPCIPYNLVYPEQPPPTIIISCDNGDPNRIRIEVNGLRRDYSYSILHIYPPNNRVFEASIITDSAGHSSLVTSSGSYIASLNAGRHTLVFYAGLMGSLERYSITFDIQYPFDCNSPVTLDLNTGNAGIPEDIIHPPRAVPAVKYGKCEQGQEQTTSPLVVGNTICIPPGYAAFIGCKRIEAPASIIAQYGYPGVGFGLILSIRGYVFDWYPPSSNIVDQGSGYIIGCAEPRLIPVGANFAADEVSSTPPWQFTGRNSDCEGTAEASRIYTCTLVNTLILKMVSENLVAYTVDPNTALTNEVVILDGVCMSVSDYKR